jgi:hypothetical protein
VEANVKYMLLIYLDESWTARSVAERQRLYAEQVRFTEQLRDKGQYLAGSPLQPPSSAATVRIRDGKRLLTDGPFAETREHLGGYMLIDVHDLDEAIAIASGAPLAHVGSIEVRPMREGPPTE